MTDADFTDYTNSVHRYKKGLADLCPPSKTSASDQDGITEIKFALSSETTNKRTKYMKQRFARLCTHQEMKASGPREMRSKQDERDCPAYILECLGLHARRRIEPSHLTGSGKRAESRHLGLTGQRTGEVRLTQSENSRDLQGPS